MPGPHRDSLHRSGFTIIELIVALVIIAVLASIAVPNYRKVRVHAEAAAISHDMHLLEDAVIRAVIEGSISPGNAPRNYSDLQRLLPGNQALMEPRLPEGMSIQFSGMSGSEPELLIMVKGDDRHRDVLDALAAMRPVTAQEVGVWVIEALDYRTLAIRNPSVSPSGGSAG